MIVESLIVILLLLCMCYVIVLAKRLDALLSNSGPRSPDRKGPHLGRYTATPIHLYFVESEAVDYGV